MEPQSGNQVQPVPKNKLLNIIFLIVILGAIPITVAMLAMRTRQETKAARECSQPAIPDPDDCVGGEWRIAKNEVDGCVRFQCVLK